MFGLPRLLRRAARDRALAATPSKLIIIPHTHWDREWYLPFQEFRVKLVEAIDDLLDLLERRPDYRHFTLDGQTILLEDYLEVRPERRAQIGHFVQQGRLSVGPWYVLPDQFLVSPEALVRNLLVGHEQAQSLGGVLRVGYLPDPFGHISQLPQLLLGFGIDVAVLWRGLDESGATELTWQGSDGSRVLLLHLAGGYNNAAALPAPEDGLLGRVRHLARELRQRAATEYAALMNGDDHARPQAELPELIAHANPLLRDMELVHGSLAELADGVRQALSRSGRPLPVVAGELRSGRLAPVLPGVLSARMWLKQRNAASEQALERWAEPFSVLADLAEGQSASPGARQRGFLRLAWRYLLQNHPHDSITGCSVDQVHEEMRTRYDWVDQIAGALTASALARLAARINTLPSDEDVPSVASEADKGSARASPLPGPALVVFNPEAHPRTDFARVELPLVRGAAPTLRDDQGRVLPTQVLERREAPLLAQSYTRAQLRALARMTGILGRDHWSDRTIDRLTRVARLLSGGQLPPLGVQAVRLTEAVEPGAVEIQVQAARDSRHDYQAVRDGLAELTGLLERSDVNLVHIRVTTSDTAEVGFVAREVPSLGYRVVYLNASEGSVSPPGVWAANGASIENDRLAVSAEARDGTFTVRDKATGHVYRGLGRIVDEADAGDEYTFGALRDGLVVDTPSEPPLVEVTEQGPVRATLAIESLYVLPEALSDDRARRSARLMPCRARTLVRLHAGGGRIEVETELENQSRDHRLRVHFPTSARAAASHAESAYWVEARPVGVPRGSSEWAEQPVGTHPQRRFVDVSDGQRGLLVGVRGLPEYEVLSGDDGAVLALTLLRCVGWLSRADLAARPGHAGPMLPTPGAQCLGRHRFEYCLVPHTGDWTAAYEEALHFALPLAVVSVDAHPGSLPPSGSFVSALGPGVVLSALKPAEDGSGLVLRCYNTLPRPTTTRVSCGFKLGHVERLDLRERASESLPLSDPASLEVTLRAGEVLTVRLVPSGAR